MTWAMGLTMAEAYGSRTHLEYDGRIPRTVLKTGGITGCLIPPALSYCFLAGDRGG